MIYAEIEGFFSANYAKIIKERLQGETFFEFDIEICNQAGNCSLIVKSNIDDYSPDELREMFYCCSLMQLAEAYMPRILHEKK